VLNHLEQILACGLPFGLNILIKLFAGRLVLRLNSSNPIVALM
jgi:hypothetical protein